MRRSCMVVLLGFGLIGCQRPNVDSTVNDPPEPEATNPETPDEPLEYWAKALHSEDEARGKLAATMLAQRATRGEPAIPILVDALKDPDERVRMRAESALPSVGDQAIPALAQAVRQPEGGDAALVLLKRMNRQRALEELAKLLDDADARVKLTALKALRDIGIASGSRPAASVALCIRDANPEVQRQALEILGKVGAAPADVPVLLEMLLRTPAGPTANRVMILQTLARIGPGTRSAAQLLPVLKSDPEPPVRANAAAALAQMSSPGDPEVVQGLQAALADGDPAVRGEAVGALGTVVGRAPETTVKYLPDVAKAARDQIPGVRVRAAQVLDLWALPASLPIVAELLKDTDPATRGRAATALGGLKKEAAPLIEEALRSQYPEVRRGALTALDTSTPEVVAKAVPVLNELLASKEPAQRRETAEYIGKFGPPAAQAAAALAKLVNDPEPDVRKASVAALGCLGKAGVPGLTTALKSKDDDLRLFAIRTLREPKEDAAAAGAALAELLKDPTPPGLQAEAVLTLTEISPEDPGVARAVAQLARTKEQRDVCMGALKKMGGAGADALADLLKELKERKDANTLVQSSLMAMKEIGKPAVPGLIRILKDAGQPRYARETAAKNLGEIGDPSAVDGLNDATKDPDARISKAASDALAKIR